MTNKIIRSYSMSKALVSCLLFVLFSQSLSADIVADSCLEKNMTPSTPSSDFVPSDDGSIVFHVKTSLEWKRCAEGQSWSSSLKECTGSADKYSWPEALQEQQTFGGEWRLPNIRELQSIVERCNATPSINKKVFPNVPSAPFWTSSPAAGYGELSWTVDFRNPDYERGFEGVAFWNEKRALNVIRLVRDAP